MPVFQYIAVNQEGKLERGLERGTSLDLVAKALAERGLQVEQLGLAQGHDDTVIPRERPAEVATGAVEQRSMTLAEQQAPPTERRSTMATNVVGPLVGQVPLQHLQFMFKQLSMMLNAGINPAQAIETLAGQTPNQKLRHILLETRDHVVAGRPMSVGFQRYPEVFTPLMMSMIRVGEEGGFLSKSLGHLSEYIQRDIDLRNLIRRETIMPKITIFMAVFIIIVANWIIMVAAPANSNMLESPLTTVSTWYWLAPLIIVIFLYVKVGLKVPRVKLQHDAFVMNIPFLGHTIRGFAMAKFGRALGALYDSGVPMEKSIRLAADSCGNEAIRARIYPAAHRVQEGAGITETLASTGVINPVVLNMTHTGEITGDLDEMLTKISEYYEDEGQTKAKQWAIWFGVVCLLVVGIYVGYVVIKFYMSYFSNMGRAAEG